MLITIICIVLILVCAITCTARIWEKKKMDLISGVSAAACVGALIGLLVYHFVF